MSIVSTSYSISRDVTTSDTVNFSVVNGKYLCDALFVGGAGNVVVVKEDGDTQTYAAAAGTVIPVRAKRINATSTTATGIKALYL